MKDQQLKKTGMVDISRGKTQTGRIQDAPDLRCTYANTVQVRAGREEVSLLFGIETHSGQKADEPSAQLLDRIAVSPATAKKLSILLTRVFSDYEKRYGPLTGGGTPVPPPARQADSRQRTEETPRETHPLFQLVERLGTQIGHEQSFKAMPSTLLKNRFLLGFKKESVPGNRQDKILAICRQIEMPADYLDRFAAGLPESNIVLFGYEKEKTGQIYKAYLEFGGRFETAFAENAQNPSPFLLHLGFKWDGDDDSRQAIAEYWCFPSFSTADMRKRIQTVFDGDNHRTANEIACGILDRAEQRAGNEKFLYLEVSEEGNPRRSFDINVYRANMRMQELYPLMTRMCDHYKIPMDQFRRVYDPAKHLVFGHLSGGVDRKGRDFLTWYYGVKGSTI